MNPKGALLSAARTRNPATVSVSFHSIMWQTVSMGDGRGGQVEDSTDDA